MLDSVAGMHDLCLNLGSFLQFMDSLKVWHMSSTTHSLSSCTAHLVVSWHVDVSSPDQDQTYLLHCKADSLLLDHQGSSKILALEKKKVCSCLFTSVPVECSRPGCQTCFSRSTVDPPSLWDLKTCRSCLGNESKQVLLFSTNCPFIQKEYILST